MSKNTNLFLGPSILVFLSWLYIHVCLEPLILVFFYWFYINICFGLLLSKIIYQFSDIVKKITFKNIGKFIIVLFWKFLQNWGYRAFKKGKALWKTIILFIKAIPVFIKKVFLRKKFLKRLFRSKKNLEQLKYLLKIFWALILNLYAFINEAFLLQNIILWLLSWRDIIKLLMERSIFITRFAYLVFLTLFGVLFGFFFGIYVLNAHRRDEELYRLFLLFLLQILYTNGFDNLLLEYLQLPYLETGTMDKFSLRILETINPRSPRLVLKKSFEKPQIPLAFPIIEDPVGVNEIFLEKTTKLSI